MKLLFLHSISSGSGANVHIGEFLAAAQALGAEVRCVGQAAESVRVQGRRIPIRVPQFCKDLVYLAGDRKYKARALAVARDWRPDAVYFRGAPYMTYGRAVAAELGLPLFYELNAPYPDEHIQYNGGRFEGIARAGERANRREARRIFTVSRQLAAIVTADGVPAEKVVVVPNAVRTERFDAAPRADDGAVRFGFVGSLQVWHGLEILLQAFDEVLAAEPAATLDIVGDGPLAGTLAERLQTSPHRDRMRWRGALPGDRIPGFLQEMDVLLAPYPPLERFYFSPLKLFEYMAAGRAIVASEIGQIADVLTDGKDARLLPPGDAGALATCCRALVGDAGERRRLGAAARVTAASHTWDENARIILRHVHDVLTEGTAS